MAEVRRESAGAPVVKLAYTVREAAVATGLGKETIHRAIHTTDPRSFPPPLLAKRAGRKYLILADELRDWLRRLEDA